jgi:hypothetical protein
VRWDVEVLRGVFGICRNFLELQVLTAVGFHVIHAIHVWIHDWICGGGRELVAESACSAEVLAAVQIVLLRIVLVHRSSVLAPAKVGTSARGCAVDLSGMIRSPVPTGVLVSHVGLRRQRSY